MSNAIKQQLMVDGQALDNNDPLLVIKLDPSTGVQLADERGADTLTYLFVNDVAEDTEHNLTLSFLYKDKYYAEVPLTLSQQSVARAVVVDKPLDVTIFEEGSAYPFDVTVDGESVLGTIKEVVITATDYIHTSGGANWWIYDGPTAGGEITVQYDFKVVGRGKDIPVTHTAKFNLAAWDGKYLKLEGAPVGIFTANGNPYSYSYSATFHGKPYSDKVRLLAMDWPTVVSETTEGNVNTVTVSSAVGNWTRVDFIYDRTDSATIVENVDRVTVNTEVRVQTDTGLRLTRVGDIQHISGWLGDQLVLENYFLLENGNTVPWTDPRIVGEIIEGSSTKPNRNPQAKIIGYDVKGPIIEFTGPDWDVESNNYMKFWMEADPATTTDVSEFYITPKVVKLSVPIAPASFTGKLGQQKTVTVTVMSGDTVVPNNTEGLVFAPADHLKFISATETTVTYEITFDNTTAYNTSISPVVTVSLPKHLSTTYNQAITVTPTRLVTITDPHPISGDIARPQQNDYLALRFNLSDGNGKTYGIDHPDVTVTPVGDHAINKGVVLTETVYEGLVVRTNTLYVNLAPQYNVTIAGVPGSNTVTFYFDVVRFVAPRPSNGGFTGWNTPMLPNTVFDPLYFTTTPDTPNNPNRPNVYGFKLVNPANSNAMLKPHGRPIWRNNRNEIGDFETGWTGGYVTGSGWLMYERWGRLTKINTAGFTVPKVPIVVDEFTETVEANGEIQTCYAIISQIRTGGLKVNPSGTITGLAIDGVATTLDTMPLTVTNGRFEFKLQPSSLPKAYKVTFSYTDEIGMAYPGTIDITATKTYEITIQDSPILTDMWKKGTTYPFKVLNKGVEAPAEEIIILGLTSNGVVKSTATVGQWSIESEVATPSQDVVVEYTYRMTGDTVETVRTASGTFKVAMYDGVELKFFPGSVNPYSVYYKQDGSMTAVGVRAELRGVAHAKSIYLIRKVSGRTVHARGTPSASGIDFQVMGDGATYTTVMSKEIYTFSIKNATDGGVVGKEMGNMEFWANIYNYTVPLTARAVAQPGFYNDIKDFDLYVMNSAGGMLNVDTLTHGATTGDELTYVPGSFTNRGGKFKFLKDIPEDKTVTTSWEITSGANKVGVSLVAQQKTTYESLKFVSTTPITGAVGDQVEVDLVINHGVVKVDNTTLGISVTGDTPIKFISATADKVKFEITKTNDGAESLVVDAPVVITTDLPKVNGITYNQSTTITPTAYDIVVTDAPISTEMWKKGTNVPFTLFDNVRQKALTPIVDSVTPNGVVKATTTPGEWSIESDIATDAQTLTVAFTYHLAEDDTPRTASGTFNVAAYDGKPLVMEFVGFDQADPRIHVNRTTTGQYFDVRVKNKGSVGGITHVSAGTGSSNIVMEASGSGGTTIRYTIKTNTMKDNAVVAITPRVRDIATNTIVEGTMNIQVFGFKEELQYALRSYGIEGKYGDEIEVWAKLYDGNQLVNLANTTITLDNTDMVEVVPGSASGQYFKVRFKEQTDVAREQTLGITFALTATPTTKSVLQNWAVKQNPDLMTLTLSDDFETTGEGTTSVILKQSAINPE